MRRFIVWLCLSGALLLVAGGCGGGTLADVSGAKDGPFSMDSGKFAAHAGDTFKVNYSIGPNHTATPQSLLTIEINGDFSSTIAAFQVTLETKTDSVGTFPFDIRDDGEYWITVTGEDSSFAVSVTD